MKKVKKEISVVLMFNKKKTLKKEISEGLINLKRKKN